MASPTGNTRLPKSPAKHHADPERDAGTRLAELLWAYSLAFSDEYVNRRGPPSLVDSPHPEFSEVTVQTFGRTSNERRTQRRPQSRTGSRKARPRKGRHPAPLASTIAESQGRRPSRTRTASRWSRAQLLHAVATSTPVKGSANGSPKRPPFERDRPDHGLTARPADRAIQVELNDSLT